MVRKGWYFLISSLNRVLDLARSRTCDLIFIQRETFPLGPPGFEWLLARSGIPIVYDFDDALWIKKPSAANRALGPLTFPAKVASIIRWSRQVIAGNRYLRDYALRFNPRVTVIPTAVDTDRFRPRPRAQGRVVTLGWIGSHSTASYLKLLDPVLPRLARRYEICLKVVGGTYDCEDVRVSNHEWRLDREVADLQSFDIGLVPLPDDEWTRGKCALKAIQYMAVGLPVVCSPVGMNAEVVQDGVNGFIAQSEADWVDRTAALIEDRALREQMGRRGRALVEDRFAVTSNVAALVQVLQQASER
jgi:glycosyltransferase involved in cell wall biosynthesis